MHFPPPGFFNIRIDSRDDVRDIETSYRYEIVVRIAPVDLYTAILSRPSLSCMMPYCSTYRLTIPGGGGGR